MHSGKKKLDRRMAMMDVKKVLCLVGILVVILCSFVGAAEKEIEIRGRQLVFQKPPFTVTMPADFKLVHSSVAEYPNESSLTRIYFLIRERSKQAEEMAIVQIAEKTDPMAGSMVVPPLKPDSENQMYVKNAVRKDLTSVDFLVQVTAWNPKAPSLQPLLKKGIEIPQHLALQGQLLFNYGGLSAVLIKYSRDVNSFGVRVSKRAGDWFKGSVSGDEKKVEQAFEKDFMKMIDTLAIKGP